VILIAPDALSAAAQCAICEAECARVRILGGRAEYMRRRADDYERVKEAFDLGDDLMLQAATTYRGAQA
jgi:flavoprotein